MALATSIEYTVAYIRQPLRVIIITHFHTPERFKNTKRRPNTDQIGDRFYVRPTERYKKRIVEYLCSNVTALSPNSKWVLVRNHIVQWGVTWSTKKPPPPSSFPLHIWRLGDLGFWQASFTQGLVPVPDNAAPEPPLWFGSPSLPSLFPRALMAVVRGLWWVPPSVEPIPTGSHWRNNTGTQHHNNTSTVVSGLLLLSHYLLLTSQTPSPSLSYFFIALFFLGYSPSSSV